MLERKVAELAQIAHRGNGERKVTGVHRARQAERAAFNRNVGAPGIREQTAGQDERRSYTRVVLDRGRSPTKRSVAFAGQHERQRAVERRLRKPTSRQIGRSGSRGHERHP